MRIRILALLAAMTLGGCGYYEWRKEGMGEAEFKADSTACAHGTVTAEAFDQCMRDRGWTLD